MASKKKTCDMCGRHCTRSEMIIYKDKFMCDSGCIQLWKESYEDEEAKKK